MLLFRCYQRKPRHSHPFKSSLDFHLGGRTDRIGTGLKITRTRLHAGGISDEGYRPGYAGLRKDSETYARVDRVGSE